MSRSVMFAVALLLLASTVSAEAVYNATVFTNSVDCGATNVTAGSINNSTLDTHEGASLCNRFTFTGDNATVYVQAVCNSTTGVLSFTIANDADCKNATSTFWSSPTSPKCNAIDNTTSVLVPNCAIVANPTTPPTNITTTAPPTTPAPINNGTGGSASATAGAGFSMLIAAAAVLLAAFL